MPLYLAAALIFLVAGFGDARSSEVCGHNLKIELHPEAHGLTGEDDIQVKGRTGGGEINFELSDKANVKSVLVNGKPSKYSFSSGKLTLSALSAGDGPFLVSISYDAIFNDPVISEPVTFDNPGFGVTGSIGEKGTFLLEDSGWYPRPVGPATGLPACEFAAGRRGERFDLQVTAPRGIYAVTAGELIGHEDRDTVSISRWRTDPTGQGLSLSAGRYVIRSKKDGHVPIFTYFTSENDSLSQIYLDASASHIEFYERLHGPYPFSKFAVVENFFPTGYGFPSYTLLGGSVLRLPFIPQTSLRHEIAHSWWGNGVLVDYASGNWCEGLTTYVADYLSKEGDGPAAPSAAILQGRVGGLGNLAGGPTARQQILRDYATLAASGDDLPLRLFGGRSSPSTWAVGYGKAAFVFHMVRQKLGDEAFWKCLRRIYKERLFVRTSWSDFRDVFVRVGGWDAAEAKVFFDQWIARSGAPVLKLENVQSRKADAAGWLTTGSVVQDRPWYDLDVTVALKTSQSERIDTKIRIKDGSAALSIASAATPEKLIVDPDANTFRLLYPGEIPATVNSVKGSHGLAAVLTEDGGRGAAFKLLLESLDQPNALVMSEKEAETKIGEDKDLLFFGLPSSEKLKSFLASVPEEAKHQMTEIGEGKTEGSREADCLFLVFKDPGRGGAITAVFAPGPKASADSILKTALKITHYGKYSYLAFSKGAIQAKGVWEVSNSPLEFDFSQK